VARIELGDGSFMDIDGVQQVIDQLTKQLDPLDAMITKSQDLLHIVSPDWQAKEPLTQSFHTPMQASHLHDLDGYRQLRDKLAGQIDNLKKARQYYIDADQSGAHGLNQRDA
jgi:hypothetical protein